MQFNICFAIDYDWVLFDADETLFHFDSYSGLKNMFSKYGVDFTRQDFEEYEKVNKPLWVEYQKKAITAEQLQQKRFDTWANRLNVHSQQLNDAFLDAMAELCTPIEGAVDLLRALKGQGKKLAIITNGFTKLQQARLERTGLREVFEFIVISEQVGVAKPDRRIFDHALEKMGNPPRERVLMVGDTAESDILGGMNSGLDTCWLNTHRKLKPDTIDPTYQVFSLKELEELFIGFSSAGEIQPALPYNYTSKI